jgi:hypothetical protein
MYHRLPKSNIAPKLDLISPFGDAASTCSGLFTAPPTGSTWMPGEEMNITVWDRLPTMDLKDVEMPSKIEWFACPEGPTTVIAIDRYILVVFKMMALFLASSNVVGC